MRFSFSLTLNAIYLKDINFREIILVYPQLNVMLFKFLFSHKTFFCASLFFNDILYLVKVCQKKVTTQIAQNFTWFCFFIFLNFVFICKGSHPRSNADLLRFQSSVKDPIHLIILTKSIFIYSFHVFALVYEQERSKNNM